MDPALLAWPTGRFVPSARSAGAMWRAPWRPDGARSATRSCRREPGEFQGGVGQGEAAGFSPQRAGVGEVEEGSAAVLR
jgi:hypothetical protein